MLQQIHAQLKIHAQQETLVRLIHVLEETHVQLKIHVLGKTLVRLIHVQLTHAVPQNMLTLKL
jgi:hypothetical protein